MEQSNSYPRDTSTVAHEMRDKASDQFARVSEHVEGAVKSVAERGKEVGEDVQRVAGNLKSAVDTSVKDQPMATLAMAAALGFVLGALWKS